MDRVKSIINVLTRKIGDNENGQRMKNMAMSVIVCISAGIMLIMNIIRHSTLMTITSLILVGGFALTGVLAGVFRKVKFSTVLMAMILTGVFTVFPLSGGNEGFAVLWILLIPLFSISLFGLGIGFGMNLYFIALVILLFYTPLRANVENLYTSNFISRFPVLFLADSLTAQFLAIQSEYYYRKTKLQTYMDDMTGVYNRKYFMEKMEHAGKLDEALSILVIDVNGLKRMNDSLGHAAGDELICSVPMLAKKAFGKDAVIARMGGDEFAVMAYEDKNATLTKVEELKKSAVKHKGKLIGEVSVSVGVASTEDYPALTMEELYQKADMLMYEDKSLYYGSTGHDRRRR